MDGSQGGIEEARLEPASVRRFLSDNPRFLTADQGLLAELGLKIAVGNGLDLGPTALGLFGERAEGIQWMAMVRMAIWEPSRQGLLAFGSTDAEGFTEDMGTELVAFLARVVERTAERWPVL